MTEKRGPLFSVVLPTYNRAGLVTDAVESVLAQSYSAYEFTVVDDQSTDNTRAVLAKIGDARVTVIGNNRSKGSAGARNTGILRARGEWICQIDSDDLWPSDMLERLAEAIASAPDDVAVVYGGHTRIDLRTGAVIEVDPADQAGDVHERELAEHFICHGSAALRADALRNVGGYDEAFRRQEDSDLMIRLTERYPVVPVPSLMYVARAGAGDQLMQNGDQEALAALVQLFNKHAGQLARLPNARYRQLTHILYHAAQARDWPRLARSWVMLVPSAWEAPSLFVHAHKRLGGVFVEVARWHVRHRLGPLFGGRSE